MFIENSEVSYKGMNGVVSFICSSYIIIELAAAKGRNSPRLVVYPDQYINVEVFKDSQK